MRIITKIAMNDVDEVLWKKLTDCYISNLEIPGNVPCPCFDWNDMRRVATLFNVHYAMDERREHVIAFTLSRKNIGQQVMNVNEIIKHLETTTVAGLQLPATPMLSIDYMAGAREVLTDIVWSAHYEFNRDLFAALDKLMQRKS